MRILYDGQIYSMQTAGGINRYFANLIERLPQDFDLTLTTCQLQQLNYPTHPNLKTVFYKRFGFRPGRLCYWLEQHYFRGVNLYKRPHLIHPTYYWTLTRQKMNQSRVPVVLSVWDMIHEVFYPDDAVIEAKREAIQSAQAILCISENTKIDLLERYPVAEDKITVTYLATEMDVSLSYGSEPVPTQPYYLYVGSRYSYKNFDGFLTAFAKIAPDYSDLKICIVGSPLNDQEERLIAELKLTDRIEHYGYASDRHLAKLYRCSVALVYPSRYEGFGIPPLEAMACETTVIAAKRSSIPEVVGDAGLLFNPCSTDELIDQLRVVLDHPMERDRLINAGKLRAQEFSWDKTVSQTLEVYRSVI